LTAVVLDVFPEAEQKECFRHLIQNYMKPFVGKEHMYPASQTYKSQVYEQHHANFLVINGVGPWLIWVIGRTPPSALLMAQRKCKYKIGQLAIILTLQSPSSLFCFCAGRGSQD
jgi:hypothetical protein